VQQSDILRSIVLWAYRAMA